jgi:hypothetical protein
MAGPDVELPLLLVELRLLGGALARPAAVPNAVSGRAAAFSAFLLGIDVPGLGEAARRAAGELKEALSPWDAGVRLLNFAGAGDPETVQGTWDVITSCRLAALVSAYDPYGLFRQGQALPRATTNEVA